MTHNLTLHNINGSTGSHLVEKAEPNMVKLVFPNHQSMLYPYRKLTQIPYFASYFNFNWLARQATNEYKIYGDVDTFQYIMDVFVEDHEVRGDRSGSGDGVDYQKIYELADYLGLSRDKLDQKMLEQVLYQLPLHLIDRRYIHSVPEMLANYRGRTSGKEVCLVYALDIDTTLSSSEIHNYVNQISGFSLNEESTQIFDQWINRSNAQQLEWLFEYRKTPVLMDFLRSMAEKHKVDRGAMIGFYVFLNIGEFYVRKIKQEVAVQQMIETWVKQKPWLGGDTTRETWLMLHVYIGFRVIESKSTLHFYRKFDQAKVKEDNLGHQWIDKDGAMSLLDLKDLEFVFNKKEKETDKDKGTGHNN